MYGAFDFIEHRTMEIYRLKSLLSIVKTGNLTRSANELNISQSALSSQLKHLEEELGFVVFDRSPRGMSLNAAGRELIPFIEALIEGEQRLLLKAQTLRAGGSETLNLGLNTDPSFLRVGAINQRLKLLYHEMNVIFLTSPTAIAAQRLRQGQLDLAFIYGQPSDPDIRYQALLDVSFCIAIPKQLSRHKDLKKWSDIAALPWVWVEQGSLPYDNFMNTLSSHRLSPNRAVTTADENIVRELVIDGQGAAIMRDDEARELVLSGHIEIWSKGWFKLPLGLAWRARDEDKFQIRTACEVISYLWQEEKAIDKESGRFNY